MVYFGLNTVIKANSILVIVALSILLLEAVVQKNSLLHLPMNIGISTIYTFSMLFKSLLKRSLCLPIFIWSNTINTIYPMLIINLLGRARQGKVLKEKPQVCLLWVIGRSPKYDMITTVSANQTNHQKFCDKLHRLNPPSHTAFPPLAATPL